MIALYQQSGPKHIISIEVFKPASTFNNKKPSYRRDNAGRQLLHGLRSFTSLMLVPFESPHATSC